MALLHSLVTILVELPNLCVLTLTYIFPGVESFTVINFFRFSLIFFTAVPFSIQMLTLFLQILL